MSENELEQYRWTCERAVGWLGNRTAAQILADIPTDLGIDRYGAGGAVEALERATCEVLGKPAAVFMPSGTMAQQIAIRIHADRSGSRVVAFHPTCHMELHEDKAYQRLHNLIGKPIGNAHELLTLKDLEGVTEPLAAVLFELPQREIGGRLPSWEDLAAQTTFMRERGVALHLDGARIWECGPFYQRTPAEIAALFDTVYVSFYKGLGGLAGCCLAGEQDVIDEARAWRKRHGGTLHGMWPNAASALAGLRKRLPLMPSYYEHAVAIARALGEVPGVAVVPDPPQTPMMHLRLRVADETFRANACRIAREQSVFTWSATSPTDTPGVRGLELTVGDATLQFSPEEVASIIRDLIS
jgi:threonine aldolase